MKRAEPEPVLTRLDKVLLIVWAFSCGLLVYYAYQFYDFLVHFARFNNTLMYGGE